VLDESGRKPVNSSDSPSTPWFKVGVGAAIAGQSMVLGLAVNLARPEEVARLLLHAVLVLSALAVFALLGWPLVRSAWESLRRRRVTIEFLFLVGIVGAFTASLHSTLTGLGAVYYEVVAVLLTVYTAGKTLGAQSRTRAFAEARRLRETFDTCRLVQPDGRTVEVPAAQIQPGDRVQVFAGEAIPIDGRIERGEAFVRETPLTGEPFPVVRRVGDAVFAGSYSEDGELAIVATASGTQRRLDGLLAQVEGARDVPSQLQAQADRIVRWFLPLVLVVAAGTFVFWTVRLGWAVGLFNAMAVLLVACPCAMGLATPAGLWSALAALASRGFVARGGDAIDRLAGVTHVVFDKTGTLSEERASLIDLATSGEASQRQELLAMLHAVQKRSTHPVARAFPKELAGIKVKSFKPVPARGIEAWVVTSNGHEVHLRIGQREFMTQLARETDLLSTLRHLPGDQLVYVEADGQLAGIAAVREQLRDSTRGTFAALESLGVPCSVLTGDRQQRADDLGLPNASGGLTTEEKVNRVRTLRAQGERVIFVGDGVNDAPAMAASDVGVALNHGAGLTTASADVVLYGGDLRTVAWALALCRRVRSSIRSNLIFAASYNAVGIALAAAGVLHPVVAALLMVVSSAIVSWRAVRSAQQDEPCCVPTATLRSPSAELPAWRNWLAQPKLQTAYGVLLALQGPFIAWLGQLSTVATVVAITACTLAGIAIARFRSSDTELSRYAVMTFAMLALGNWGMLLGWWAEAGFAPVMRSGVCLCCHARDYFALTSFKVPWMYLGMLALGLPPMLAAPLPARLRAGRLWTGLVSGIGMVVGMAWGASLMLRWAGPMHPQQFLLALGGMTLGMLAGMFFACELARVLTWRSSRQ
jgi:heavy metal translocating P-type ATPase